MAVDAWTLRTQLASKPTAIKHGDEWTSEDMNFVQSFADELDAELARTLGRTLYAIQSIRKALRAGKTARTRVAASDRPYRGWREGDGDE